MPDTAVHRPFHHGNLRTALLEAAERNLRKQGAEQLSLRDLAREIGVSHAAPRRHFADRQALLDALAEDGFARLGSALRAATAEGGPDFSTRVTSTVVAFASFATENAALHELMNSGKHRPGAGRIAAAAELAFSPMVELIAEGQRRHELEQGSPEQIGIVLFATVQGITTMVNGELVSPELLDPLIATAVRQFLRGAHPVD
jgi:AcrR family transcriptional regulator